LSQHSTAALSSSISGSAKNILMLVDPSKCGQVAFAEAFETEQRIEIISDHPLPRFAVKMIGEKGATITFA